MKLRDIAASMIAAVGFLALAYGIDYVEHQTQRATAEQEQVQAQLGACRQQLDQETRERDELHRTLDNADYYLWEVHALDRDPRTRVGDDTPLERACEKVGDPSVLRDNTELHGYSLWNDATGQLKLGCRFVRRKEPSP